MTILRQECPLCGKPFKRHQGGYQHVETHGLKSNCPGGPASTTTGLSLLRGRLNRSKVGGGLIPIWYSDEVTP